VFPDRFGSLRDARAFMDEFRDRYNHEHHHSGLGLHTPAEVHYGLAAAKAADRAHVLNTARAAHPERFSTPDAVPKILALPDAAWINNPANRDDPQTYQPAA
ncbi:integrase core domain-containing protein, partial [Brachybacterium muris]